MKHENENAANLYTGLKRREIRGQILIREIRGQILISDYKLTFLSIMC
jgi:hypothetical protein